MRRYAGWLMVVVLLTLGGSYTGVVYHNSVKVGGGYEGGSGLSVQDDGALLSTSTLQGTQLVSTAATGTPPIAVASTTVVPNLYVARSVLADGATTAFDISDDTNLTASGGIVRTDDTLTHDTAAGYRHIPSGGTAGQALVAQGTSGVGLWADGSGSNWTNLAQLRVGGTGTGAETSIANDGTLSTYHITATDLTVQGAAAYFDLGTTVAPWYHVTLTAPTTLAGSIDVSYPTEGGTMVVMAANGTSGQLMRSDGDGTVSWVSPSASLGNVESLTTVGASGTAPVSNGSGGLVMTAVPTTSQMSAVENKTQKLNSSGNISSALTAQLAVQTGSGVALKLGGDNGATTLTDSTEKRFRLGSPSYANAQVPVAALYGKNMAATAELYIGGGSADMNCPTYLGFSTAADSVTTTGTVRMSINSAGVINHVGLTTTGGGLHVGGTSDPGTDNLIVDGTSTLTGAVGVGGSESASKYLSISNAAGYARGLRFNTGSLNRWGIQASTAAESGTNAGSNLQILNFDDAGAFIGVVAEVSRATSNVAWAGALTTVGGVHVGGTSIPGADNLIVDGTGLVSGVLSLGSTPVSVSNSAGKLLWAAMETPTVKETLILTAAGGEPTTTAGCAASAKKETTTYKRNYRSLDFDPGTDESAFWNITTLPDNYAGGTFIPNIRWKASGTGNVCWVVSAVATSNGDTYDAAVGTTVTATVAVMGVGEDTESTLSALTAAGTPVAGDSLYVVLTRDANNAADTVAGDVEVLGVSLDYTGKVSP